MGWLHSTLLTKEAGRLKGPAKAIILRGRWGSLIYLPHISIGGTAKSHRFANQGATALVKHPSRAYQQLLQLKAASDFILHTVLLKFQNYFGKYSYLNRYSLEQGRPWNWGCLVH